LLSRIRSGQSRKALYAVSGSSFGIVGMPQDDADAPAR